MLIYAILHGVLYRDLTGTAHYWGVVLARVRGRTKNLSVCDTDPLTGPRKSL